MRERDVAFVAGTASDADTLLAYDLACAIARYGAGRLTWICPYSGYQTQERSAKAGEVVTAKTRARLISAVQQYVCLVRLVLFERWPAPAVHRQTFRWSAPQVRAPPDESGWQTADSHAPGAVAIRPRQRFRSRAARPP